MFRFMHACGFDNYDALYQWSVTNLKGFWSAVAEAASIQFTAPPSAVAHDIDDMLAVRWFPGATLNYAEHLLRHAGSGVALIFRDEAGDRLELSFDELRMQVAAAAAGLRAKGVIAGDRVAGILPNCPEAIIAMLATASIGAVWSSCSPDFGANGIVDRFGQIAPKVLFATNGYRYNGKRIDCSAVTSDVVERIPSVEVVVVVPFLKDDAASAVPGIHSETWQRFLLPGSTLSFTAVPFDHPLFVMFSSGTTGVPKCIVHGHGGTLLQHWKEHALHCDIRSGERVFYFTTCGWMMWNWLASALTTGATLVLFDGAPFHDAGKVLWTLAEEERVNVFGTSAKYISALQKSGLRPRDQFDLSALRAVLSTGSPLAADGFDFVYDAIASDIQLSSIAGGTDIIGCFISGNPMLPVIRGELQCRALGMDVDVFDELGRSLRGERGELVCKRAFPSQPVGFWNDVNNTRYRAAYFERFPGTWAHGDFAELRPGGGMVIHGRSDAVLNPGGVRIGTAEIYRQVERLDDVLESIAIGQDWQDDVRVVLFVVLREGLQLNEELEAQIRGTIRRNTTPRHVPAKIIQVAEIPRTRSGKIVELAVRDIVHGRNVSNTEALENPDALEHFRNLAELAAD